MNETELRQLPYACVFLFRDGRVLVDGARIANVQVDGLEREGRRFLQLGHLWGAMLFIEARTELADPGA